MSQQSSGKGANTAIIVAVIGLVGTLITGILTSPLLIEYLRRDQPTAEATSTTLVPTKTPMVTATTMPSMLTFTSNSNCRILPGTGFSVTFAFKKGDKAVPTGRTPDNLWYRVTVPDTESECWVSASAASLSGSAEEIPTVQP